MAYYKWPQMKHSFIFLFVKTIPLFILRERVIAWGPTGWGGTERGGKEIGGWGWRKRENSKQDTELECKNCEIMT